LKIKKILILPAISKEYKLAEMTAQVNKENLQGEIKYGMSHKQKSGKQAIT